MPSKKPTITNHKDDLCLSAADMFYIEQHGTMPVVTLVDHLQKPAELIQAHINFLVKTMKKEKPKANTLMDRPAKGVVSMSAGASMAGDDKHRKIVTMEDINMALHQGRHEEAARLKNEYDEQIRGNKEVLRTKYADKIHYIVSVEDDPDAEIY